VSAVIVAWLAFTEQPNRAMVPASIVARLRLALATTPAITPLLFPLSVWLPVPCEMAPAGGVAHGHRVIAMSTTSVVSRLQFTGI
jgi:hypothetical protein